MWFSVLKLDEDSATNIKHKVVAKNEIKNNESYILSWKNIEYEFSWFKSTWEEVDWKIEAKNSITALKRLYEEYNFTINWLIEKNISPAIKEHKKKTSVEKILSEAFDEWISLKEPESSVQLNNNTDVFNSKEEKDAIEEDVKKFTGSLKILLKNCNWIIQWINLSEIQNKISELEKIQKSNNLFLIQSELEELLKKVDSYFNDKNKEDLPKKSLIILSKIGIYLWVNTKDIFNEKILPFLEKFSFLKDYLNKLNKYLDNKKDIELIQKKNNLNRYIRRFFHHLIKLITVKDKEEKKRRIKALRKTYLLIVSTYKTYSWIKKDIKENKAKYYLEFRKWNKKIYRELRFISSLILFYYFIYFIFIDFWIRKWIFMNYKLWYFTISSKFIFTFLFASFLINFISLLKIKYFLKNIYFNLFFWWPIFILAVLFYYANY